MQKSANLNIRMNPKVKEEAEDILKSLGIPPSSAIDMFYRQVILTNGLPFDVKLPEKDLLDISSLSQDELIELINQGIKDLDKGNTKSLEEAFKDIYKSHDEL